MGKTILIVDDTEDTREVMRIILEMCGYFIIEAADGSEAVKNTIEQNPDLVLMDVSMPIMDGLTATKVIRSLTNKTQLPIIALTAHGKNYYKRVIEAGCNDLIPKPVDFDALQPVIQRYLTH